jgi:pyruvate,orthophosphate dikinase
MTRWTLQLDGTTLPDKALIGGKAWSIARMLGMGLNVPPAFVVTTEACNAYLAESATPEGLEAEIDVGLAWLEQRTGRRFGQGAERLLLSVRSGAAISMPGMMDTVLNLGIDEEGEAALAAETGQPGFAHDTHRRFHELYAAIVLKGAVDPLDPDAGVASWREAIKAGSGEDMPANPRDQLLAAIRAVFDSWNTRRAKRYRQHNNIPDDLGTAVTVQAMVFGNLDADSGTGVLFSRNPLTGERLPFGEYLPRAQGEDVVSGKFTPLPLDAMRERVAPAHAGLLVASERLEREHGDVQDIEFTVQRGELFLLQARSAKRSPEASARIAVEMVDEGLIDIDTALGRVSAEQASAILLPRLDPATAEAATLLLSGEGACPGIASGIAVTDPDEAERRAEAGEDVILVRETTSPDDIHGMIAARAVVTAQGGATSHAAVVSRALGRPCVVGGGADAMALAGRLVTVDGEGRVYADRLAVRLPDEQADPTLARLIAWAAERSPVAVVADSSEAAIDLDHEPDAAEPEGLARLLAGQAAARGQLLATPDAARAAYRGGVRTLVTSPLLPPLLAILSAAREGRG